MILSVNNNADNFKLAPSTSTYAGEGRYSFVPTKAKYIHITIAQDGSYYDITNKLYTWAIGIKNIEIDQNQYLTSSELISNPFAVPAGISEISLDADILPDKIYETTELPSQASALFDISVDGGMNWYPIAPSSFQMADTILPVLNINNIASQSNPSASNSINTTATAISLLYRIRLQQNNPNIADTTLLPYYSPIVSNITIKAIQQETLNT
jgi:hypothetical protein